MSNYDVTLVITTYNEEKYLPVLLDSIKKQNTNLKIDILIVDDFSTDKTFDIAKENGARIIHNDRKSDVQYMRNLGLKNALGKTIIFCDADVALSSNYIENMIKPIIEDEADTSLCKTYGILEAFFNILPDEYSKSYVWFIRHCPKFMLKRFPVQFVPWILRWFKIMKEKSKFVSIWTIPNRTHTTGIATRTSIAMASGGWKVRIGDGDDAQYSNDICDMSDRVIWAKKCTLYISKRRVFPNDKSWISEALFGKIKKIYRKNSKCENDYDKSIR